MADLSSAGFISVFDFQLDVRDFMNRADDLGGALDQLPFAMSRALNDAATETRHMLVDETWPHHVTQRNSGFIGYALRIEFSTKQDLRVVISDQTDSHAHLKLHAEGGIKQAKGRLAIPTEAVNRTAQGVQANQKPANMPNKVVRGNAIYQYQGKGKNRKLTLMFVLAHSAKQPADVPFKQDFDAAMRESAMAHFPQRMKEAMATRR